MPLISTSGALSINKVALGLSNNYWFIQWNDKSLSFESIAFDGSNQLFCTGVSPVGFWISLKVNQDSGLPIVAWQRTFSGYTNLSGTFNYFNRYNNLIYNVGQLYVSTSSDQSAGTIIYNRDGTVSGQYIDNNQFFSPSTTYPWFRRADRVLSDSTGDYWIAGVVNEKINSTTNQFLTYYSKFSGGTKIYSKVLIDSISFGASRGTIVQMQFTNSGDLLILTEVNAVSPTQDILTLISINPVTNTINWQIKWAKPASATTFTSNYTQDNSGNIYISFRVSGGSSAGAYLQKYNSAGSLVWTRKENSGSLITNMATDANGYVYLIVLTAGVNNNNIIKIDGNYNIQWQRRITTTSVGKNIQTESIYCDKDNIYLLGTASIPSGATGTSAFIMKLPNDGTIPSPGTYVVSAALTVTYTSSTTVSFIAGSPASAVSGTLSIANATVKAYDPISLGVSNTVNPTTVTDL